MKQCSTRNVKKINIQNLEAGDTSLLEARVLAPHSRGAVFESQSGRNKRVELPHVNICGVSRLKGNMIHTKKGKEEQSIIYSQSQRAQKCEVLWTIVKATIINGAHAEKRTYLNNNNNRKQTIQQKQQEGGEQEEQVSRTSF